MNNTGLTQERLQANFKEFDIEKGTYKDNAENRKKGRVGGKFGGKKDFDSKVIKKNPSQPRKELQQEIEQHEINIQDIDGDIESYEIELEDLSEDQMDTDAEYDITGKIEDLEEDKRNEESFIKEKKEKL